MNPALQQLKDIHLPQAVHMWPMAPGWLVLYVLLIATVLYAIYFWYQSKRKKYTVKFALAKLDKLEQLLAKNPEKINIAAEISTLLRRTALYYFRREEIASLTGKQWLDFLNRSGETTHFTQETKRLLTDAPYQKEVSNDLTPLFTLARAWLMTISKKKVMSAES